MEHLDHEITYLSILFKCYFPFSSQTTPPFSMTFGYQLHRIVSIKKLALVQVNIDRKLQGCKVPLIPSTSCLNAVSVMYHRPRKVVAQGHIAPGPKLMQVCSYHSRMVLSECSICFEAIWTLARIQTTMI